MSKFGRDVDFVCEALEGARLDAFRRVVETCAEDAGRQERQRIRAAIRALADKSLGLIDPEDALAAVRGTRRGR